MNNEMKKDALTEEELTKVSGGWIPWSNDFDPSSLVVDRTVPDYCSPVEVQDGANNSALCPYDGDVLKLANHVPVFADWLFYCEKCHKWFSKTSDGKWYVSDREPQ